MTSRGTLSFTESRSFDLARFGRAVVSVNERGVFVTGTNDADKGVKVSGRKDRAQKTVSVGTEPLEALDGYFGGVRFEMSLMGEENGGKTYRLVPVRPGQTPHAVLRPKKS